jgi:DNA-binding XRE family transcriptional regulator
MNEIHFATIPLDELNAMRARLEDQADILAAYEARSGAALPHDLAMRVIEGEHPVRVWREYRGLSASALAEKAGVSKTYLSEIETGRKPGSVEAYKALAAVLRVPIDAIVP